jgi:hypothetical protein
MSLVLTILFPVLCKCFYYLFLLIEVVALPRNVATGTERGQWLGKMIIRPEGKTHSTKALSFETCRQLRPSRPKLSGTRTPTEKKCAFLSFSAAGTFANALTPANSS